jgi:hypothetical protein
MSDPSSMSRGAGAGSLAAWSAIGGLVVAMGLGLISGRLSVDQQLAGTTALGAIGFSITFAAPFVAAIASFAISSVALRRAIWLATGLVSFVLSALTLFSGIGVLFAAAGVGLVSAWWMTRTPSHLVPSARALMLSGWLILWLSAATAALWVQATPMCWNADANGMGRWEPSSTMSSCWSDIIDDTEGGLAVLGVALAAGGAVVIVRGQHRDGTHANGVSRSQSGKLDSAPTPP